MTYRMTQINTFPEGGSETFTALHEGAAEQAHADRVRRLREAGTEYTAGPGWIETTYPVAGGQVGDTFEPSFGLTVRLEYADVQSDGGARPAASPECGFDPRSHRADCAHDNDPVYQFRAGMAAQVARDLAAEFGIESGGEPR